ncbi:hypothetical protein FIBSPDRAFT_965120 [Athelia psychrophila]|uniref:Uncharacterized protein n=1 Tax=Athelia psychrophila TaxID=1759441 RepID=A0A165WZ58_9AGAM|nr:hypothetical protein FIBSPDRAFT_965120 [Fibularhizoctonia sp. CBS 109695]
MTVNLLGTYGVVQRVVFHESTHSLLSGPRDKLREHAPVLRVLHASLATSLSLLSSLSMSEKLAKLRRVGAVNLLETYGVVPQVVFQVSTHSLLSGPCEKHFEHALILRALRAFLATSSLCASEKLATLRTKKEDLVGEVYTSPVSLSPQANLVLAAHAPSMTHTPT